MNIKKVDTHVGDLVDMITRGELRLPEMQRGYVWTSTRVRDLLDSLYRGYPSGTILVWETDRIQPSRDMAVEQADSPFSKDKLLLDGQQRLTSLSAVIRGERIKVRNRKRPIQIAFNLDHPEGSRVDLEEVDDDITPVEGEPDDETIIEGEDDDNNSPSILDRMRNRTFVVANNSLLSSSSWVLVSDIFKGEKSDWTLVKQLVSSPDDPKYDMYQKRLQRVRAIRTYPYVMQVVPRGVDYEEVAEIFVRVNSRGVKLRGSDLALALITARWPNSLQKFEAFIDECEEESWFTLDLGLVVRNLIVHATRQSRFKTVGALSRKRLEDAWSQSTGALRFAINFLRTNAGIESESLLSSPLFMIPIGVLATLCNERLSGDNERNLLRWLYVANARGHYSGSSETKLDADLSLLFKGNGAASLVPIIKHEFGRLHLEPGDFVSRGSRSALFSMTYLALKHSGAQDWFTGLGLSLNHQGRSHRVQFHHVFPKAVLKRTEYERAEVNEIANMAFIAGRTNQRLSSKRPEEYFRSIVEQRGEEALTKQLIPMNEELWKVENYREFLAERRKLLAKEVNEFIDRAYMAGTVPVVETNDRG